MPTALDVLIGHRYSSMRICVDLAGYPTNCTWQPRRGQRADNYGIQHLRHQADLIDAAYHVELACQGQLQAVRDIVTDSLAQMEPRQYSEFQRGSRQVLKELADALGIEAAS